MIPPRKL